MKEQIKMIIENYCQGIEWLEFNIADLDKMADEILALQLQQTGVMRRFLMEFMLNGKVEWEEVDCEDWSKAKHFIQRKYKLQDEPRVIREVKTYA